MAFSYDNWDKLSAAGNTVVNHIWGYESSTDALATIEAADYFLPVYRELIVGDEIYIIGSDTYDKVTVTAVSSTSVTVAPAAAVPAGSITNADINAAAAIAFSKLAPLPSAQMLVGSAGNVATAVAITGDISMSNAGVTAIVADTIVNADVNSAAAIDFSKLAALPSAEMLVGNAGNVAAAVALTGDIAITNTGVTSIAAGVIVNADVSATAAIAYSKLDALVSGNILVGSAGNVATSVTMSGDATIIASGALTLGAVVKASKVATYVPEDVIAGMPVLHVFSMAGGATATRTIATSQKITVVDAWVVLKGLGTAGDTIEVKNAAGTAITDAIDINDADKTISRAGTIDDAQRVVAAAANLQCTETDGGGNDSPACDVYVMCYVTP